MTKIAFLFPGQGSQYVGMGKELYDNIDECKEVFDNAEKVLGIDIKNLCFNGEKEELDKTENTQPAILTVSIATLMALKKAGIEPYITAGLSLGEYSSLVCSNAIDFKEAVALVKKRGKFMQEAVPLGVGAMTAIIGLESDKVRELCTNASKNGIVEISNYNCPSQIVIGGEKEAVKLAGNMAKEAGARKVVELSVSGPFHTSMLKGAAENLEKELESIDFKNIEIPYITNVNATVVENKDSIKPLLKQQVMSSVLFEDTIRNMINQGVETFVEVGPSKVLSGFVKKVNRKIRTLNVQDMESLKLTIEQLGGNYVK